MLQPQPQPQPDLYVLCLFETKLSWWCTNKRIKVDNELRDEQQN